MHGFPQAGRHILLALLVGCLWTATGAQVTEEIRIVELEGTLTIRLPGAADWVLTTTNQVLRPGYRLRIGRNSRATLLRSSQSAGQSTVRLRALTEVEILAPPAPDAQSGLYLWKGISSIFRRQKGPVRVITPGAPAGVEGTEFVIEVDTVDGTERTRIWVIDGQVRFGEEPNPLVLTNGQSAVAEVGKAPVPGPAFVANDVLQWALYYPAVLDLRDLPLTPEEEQALAESISAYRAGDLHGALEKYPGEGPAQSDAERLYYAALLLSVGQVEQSQDALRALAGTGQTERLQPLATALRQLIAAVKFDAKPTTRAPRLATEFLAASYYEQSRAVDETSLRKALNLARQATTISPEFGFAWARVAELEFSFGQTDRALEALNKSLKLTNKNAQAHAVNGFLLAAQNKISEATIAFNKAIVLDGALANGWLGRGLCRIRQGHSKDGREDLLIAAALEPQRAFLRSYLGKAYSQTGDRIHAEHELNLAKDLDPRDPTAWLYSALDKQQNNQINDAIRDLEHSQNLVTNRAIYRSRFLLDQDRAVRSANLAHIYRDAGMQDWSVLEAGRAASTDYGNYSAHLFLANSYDELRDPNFVNLRLETAANSEYLIANLLAPVGGGIFNSAISQQEYSKLFDQNRLGLVSSTESFSSGDWIERGAQFGNFDSTSYSLGALYRTARGQRPNNDVEQRQLDLQVKQQLSPKDTVYLDVSQLEIEAGDLRQYYNNVSPYPQLRTHETQEPILTLGYHREWSPGQDTLLLASWLNDDYRYNNPQSGARLELNGEFQAVRTVPMTTDFRNEIEIFSIEPQHIWKFARNVAIVGGRFQTGDFRMENLQTALPGPGADYFNDPAVSQNITSHFESLSLYAYDQFEVVHSLWVTAGIVYDRLTFPQNLFAPPFSSAKTTRDQVSPKAGVVWNAPSATTVRFGYGRSLTGASLEQSVSIEPTQIAGFNQALRGLIPESLEGSVPAARLATYGLSVEQKLGSGTYLGLSGEIADSDASRTIGSFAATLPPLDPDQPPPPLPHANPSSLTQALDYGEKSIRFTADQLLGREWALGVRYQLTHADLRSVYTDIPDSAIVVDFNRQQRLQSLLHQLGLVITFNHHSGFFSQLEADWYAQSNHGYVPSHPDDDLWQLNLFAGYRFLHRRAEIKIGLINLTDTDNHLDPLTLYTELRRGRTFTARFQFNF